MSALGCYPRIALAGFHRYSTYRQATLAGTATNIVFGLIKVGILTALYAVSSRTSIGGYDLAMAITYVWLGQGLLGVVQFWSSNELGDRIRSGDIAIDLARPWNLGVATLFTDMGRAAHGVVTRFVPQLLVGMLFFPFHWPTDPWVALAFPASVLLAQVVSSTIQFLIGLSTFWLLDSRGVAMLYSVLGATLAGLEIPLNYFPDWAQRVLSFTPFPSMLQLPINVFVQSGSLPGTLAQQLVWAVLVFGAGQLVLRRAVHKLVVQGG